MADIKTMYLATFVDCIVHHKFNLDQQTQSYQISNPSDNPNHKNDYSHTQESHDQGQYLLFFNSFYLHQQVIVDNCKKFHH